MSSDSSQAKRGVFTEWMKGDHVLVHLDSRKSGVTVPAHLGNNPTLCLKLSYQFQGETTIGDTGISSWLKFNGAYSECIIPWDAIWGFTNSDNANRVWPESMPAELIKELATAKLRELKDALLGKKPAAKPVAAPQETGPAAQPEAAAKPERQTLKRIK